MSLPLRRHSPAPPRARGWLPAFFLLVLAVSAAAAPPPAPTPPLDRADVMVVVLALTPNDAATVDVAYDQPVADAQAKQDIAQLAAELKQPNPEARVDRPKNQKQAVVVEARLSGLVNWSTGQLNLNPIINTFRRYRHVHVRFQFLAPLTVTWPKEGGEQGPVRWTASISPGSADYDVWVEQGAGGDLDITRGPGLGWRFWAAVAAAALLFGGIVYGIVYLLMGSRRAEGRSPGAAGREGSST